MYKSGFLLDCCIEEPRVFERRKSDDESWGRVVPRRSGGGVEEEAINKHNSLLNRKCAIRSRVAGRFVIWTPPSVVGPQTCLLKTSKSQNYELD